MLIKQKIFKSGVALSQQYQPLDFKTQILRDGGKEKMHLLIFTAVF